MSEREAGGRTIYVVSDSLGDTAEYVVRAAVSQFNYEEVEIRRFSFVDDPSTVEEIAASARELGAMIVYTVVVPEIRHALEEACRNRGLRCHDILTPLLGAIGEMLGQTPKLIPGLVHKLDESYFRRVEAIEFAVKYDDGKDPRGLYKADIVLVGVSRTSKTPLSMYLAHRLYKVANVPLVPEVPVPEELFQIPASKVVGLTLQPETLHKIRTARLKALGLPPDASYARMERILEELNFAHEVFRRIGCPVIDVTNKAVEETAAIILELIKGGRIRP
ncbi:MAG: hypothetical protein BLITH_0921 [Brockia lithotrophica]|uniref:Putative pyruvate, phosphate dikinase regulatory protein n=1 Tax=Brockia lithotrophica TaxID=933949 RepID=A0A2T5G6Z0_9BACL|nr:pyruvate, water dikinase regulatory protein [Brockia lithotrophica]MBE3550584.1 kinase/pyrophosphorylase [Brockia lithotrophica]MBT9253215.1 kinase/pyrophosphorylase [Brockia lithotrophica]PTQ51954.1 MAG: hypothetical protein BLITH_0921 [Brockia lithotrophica]RKQ88978.1 hypothetical protein C7438_0631 [Brockia lithotrophica]